MRPPNSWLRERGRALQLYVSATAGCRLTTAAPTSRSSTYHTALAAPSTPLLPCARCAADGRRVQSKLTLVDLAGSERVSKTRSEGVVLREAGHINKSLHMLEQVGVGGGVEGGGCRALWLVHDPRQKQRAACFARAAMHAAPLYVSMCCSGRAALCGCQLMAALFLGWHQVVLAVNERGREHVPYRSSKLTHVLKDALGGNCRTVLVANLWGAKGQLEESLSTCRWAGCEYRV